MVYERGTANSTFEVFDKLTDFMTRVPGWQMWSNIDGYGTRDFVYYSTGSAGNNDIYIRHRVGPPETFVQGADQYNYGGGDTGFLNFFSYVYFPKDGGAYSGASEIGSFGPRLFYWNGDTAYLRNMKQDVLSQRPGGSSDIIYGSVTGEDNPPATIEDTKCSERRRWTSTNASPNENNEFGGTEKTFCTDGKRYIYVADSIYGRIYRYSLARGGGGFDSSGNVTKGTLIGTYSQIFTFMCYFEDRATRTPYLFVMGTPKTGRCGKINLVTNAYSVIAEPPWPTRTWNSLPNDATQLAKTAVWDGERYIYAVRGGIPGSWSVDGSVWPDWGRYDTITNTWRTTTIPEDPEFRSIMLYFNFGYGLYYGTEFVNFLHKDITGFQYHTLVLGNSNEVWKVSIDPETNIPPTSDPSWHIYVPNSNSTFGNLKGPIFPNRHKQGRVLAYNVIGGSGPNGIYERFPNSGARRTFLYSDLVESGTTIMRFADAAYIPSASAYYGRMCHIDGYSCRVRTSIDAQTEYIFIGDEDRIIIATKSAEIRGGTTFEWSMAYLGAFQSQYDSVPYAELAEDVKAGPSRILRLCNKSGEFTENSRYFIVGVNGPVTEKTYHPEGRSRLLSSSESIKIVKVGTDFVIASLKNGYNAGAKIAIDPQPVGLFLWELEKFQVTNMAQRLYDDDNGSDDPSKQIYTLPINEATIKNGISDAAQTFSVSEMILMSAESEGYWSAREIRGKMNGVYAVGKVSSVISSGDSIAVGDDSYIIIDLPDYVNKYILIGPINR